MKKHIPVKSLTGILAACLLLALGACGREESLNKGGFNMHGGHGRTSNYEAGGDIFGRNFTPEAIKSKDSSGIICAPLTLNDYGAVVSTVNGSVILLDGRSVRRANKLDAGELAAAGMCADINRNVYVLSSFGNLYSFSPKLERRWKIAVNKGTSDILSYSDLLALKDGIVAANSNGIVAKYSFDGKLIWEYHSSLAVTDAVASDENGNLAVALSNNEPGKTDSLVYLSASGKMMWGKAFTNLRIMNHPVIFKDRIFVYGYYFINDKHYSRIFVLDKSGKILFSKELAITIRHVSCALDGEFYAMGYDATLTEPLSGLFSFSADGKLKWQIYLNAVTPVPALIGSSTIGVVGFTTMGPLAFFVSRENGEMTKQISLANAPVLYPYPLLNEKNGLFFFGSQKLSLIKINPTFFGNAVPWL